MYQLATMTKNSSEKNILPSNQKLRAKLKKKQKIPKLDGQKNKNHRAKRILAVGLKIQKIEDRIIMYQHKWTKDYIMLCYVVL